MSGALALAAARADPIGDGPKIGEGQSKSKKAVKLSKPSGEKNQERIWWKEIWSSKTWWLKSKT
jgi:hypothetical protein